MTTEKQTPEWNAACEALRLLNAIEAYQGGANGPTIQLRAAIKALATAQQAEKRESPTVEQWCTNAFNEAHGIRPADAKEGE